MVLVDSQRARALDAVACTNATEDERWNASPIDTKGNGSKIPKWENNIIVLRKRTPFYVRISGDAHLQREIYRGRVPTHVSSLQTIHLSARVSSST